MSLSNLPVSSYFRSSIRSCCMTVQCTVNSTCWMCCQTSNGTARHTLPKQFLYAAITSCLCALLLEVTRSNMASLSLPEEKQRMNRISFGWLTEIHSGRTLAKSFHGIVEGLCISAGIEVRSICYCASEHLHTRLLNQMLTLSCPVFKTIKKVWVS